MDLNLDFDIKQVEENGKSILRYYINGKAVSEDVFYTMKQEQKEKQKKSQKFTTQKQTRNINPEEYSDEDNCDCEGQGTCFTCAIRNLITEIRECDDDEAVELMLDFIDGIEEDANIAGIEEGIVMGMKNLSRNLVEQLNEVVYKDIEIRIHGDGEIGENEFEYE